MLDMRISLLQIGILRKQFNMSEYESMLSESEFNFPIINYSRREGTFEKAAELGLDYRDGVLYCSNSSVVKEIDLSQGSDILIRPGEKGLIIEVNYKSGDYEEYRVSEDGEVELINE